MEAAAELDSYVDKEKIKEKRDKERQKERARVEKDKENDEGNANTMHITFFFKNTMKDFVKDEKIGKIW